MGLALNRRATRAAHFNGVVQLALGVDRFRGALELPKTWEIGGADAPTGTSAPICLRQSIETSTASIRTSDGHPIGALGVCSVPDSAENLIDAIYILSSVTLHALATLIRRGNATTKKCSVVGGSRNPIMLTSERRRIEDLNLTISYADSRRRLGPECQH